MPPRGGRGQTEEQKKAAYDTWCNGDEHECCKKIFEERKKEGTELKEMHPGSDDIVGDWKGVLDNLWKLVDTLKVPGRKAKSM